jgi:hypothetical protein
MREVFMMAPARFNSLSGKSQRAVAAHQMDFIFKQERKDNTDVSKSIPLWRSFSAETNVCTRDTRGRRDLPEDARAPQYVPPVWLGAPDAGNLDGICGAGQAANVFELLHALH